MPPQVAGFTRRFNSRRFGSRSIYRLAGVTLVETVVAVSLATLAGGALLTTLSSSVKISTDCLHIAIANGLADQLMDEIAAVKFPPGGTGTGPGRSGFDDIDDYSNYSASPPQARCGLPLGTEGTNSSGSLMYRPQAFQPDPQMLSRYRQEVLVEKIAEVTGNQWVVVPESTTLRRVTVTISYTDAEGKATPLAVQTRVFSNVAIAP